MKLAEMTWPEVARLDRAGTLVVAPIAACEQHSRHLPTFTDTILCGAVTDGIERRLPDRLLCLPVLWLGASDHHLPFGATLSVSPLAHARLIEGVLTPLLDSGFVRFLVLNGHGGNIDTLHIALRELQPRYPNALLTGASYWELAQSQLAELAQGPRKTMGHACEFETALMLYLRPDLVRRDAIANDPPADDPRLEGLFRAEDFGQRTGHGGVGYPEFAGAEGGERMLAAVVARVAEVCSALLEAPITPGRQRRDR